MLRKKIILLIILYSTFLVQATWAQTISVHGKVKDTKGNPIISASLKVKDSKQGANSDTLGNFNIKVKAYAELIFSAIGFADTVVPVNGRTSLTVVLSAQTKALGEVVVSGSNQNAGLPSPDEPTKEQIIANTFENYLRSAEFSNGVYPITTYGQTGATRLLLSGFGSLNTVNSGVMLPVVEHQEDTKGSRYLLNKFGAGIIVDQYNKIITDSNKLLNYDKIDGQLIITQDTKNYITVDKEKVIAFALKAPDTSFIFLNVPILSKNNYFVLIANGAKYSAYKSIRSRFVKSNYRSNGLVESGNNYDEYVDQQIYYWVDQSKKTAGIFELKKKSILEAFSAEIEKTRFYFAQHKHDDIDDNFVKHLIVYLNQ
ncbi:MAG TPA: carboxypeptidase-like regulatory domain-containing protein [Puia sp.]|jgi:hypothetical protein|nr:carboxypeptidase-like regulatory domain-containing protein [Puia sp.]